eukprot:scaffold513_cov71-Phaeocystis_antarctica.AAC.1
MVIEAVPNGLQKLAANQVYTYRGSGGINLAHRQISRKFYLAAQTDTTFAPLELVQAVSESAFDMLSCDLPGLARAGRVLRPHPAMLAPVQPTHYLGGSRSDLGLKAAGARLARTRSAEQAL